MSINPIGPQDPGYNAPVLPDNGRAIIQVQNPSLSSLALNLVTFRHPISRALASSAWNWVAVPTRSVGNVAGSILGAVQNGVSNFGRVSLGYVGSATAHSAATVLDGVGGPLGLGIGTERREELQVRITELLERISPSSSEDFNENFITDLSRSLATLLAPVLKESATWQVNFGRFFPLENPRGQQMLANLVEDTLLGTIASLLTEYERDPNFLKTVARELKDILLEEDPVEKTVKASDFVDDLIDILEVENGTAIPLNYGWAPLRGFVVPKLRNLLVEALREPNNLGDIVNFRSEVVDDELGRVEAECCDLLAELTSNSLLGEANPLNFHKFGRPVIQSLQDLIDRKVPGNTFRLEDWIANGDEIAQIIRNFISEDGRAAIRDEIRPVLAQIFRYGASRLLVPIRDLDLHGPLALSNNHLVAVSATVAESVNDYLSDYLVNSDTRYDVHAKYAGEDPEIVHLQQWCKKLVEIGYPDHAGDIPLPDETREALYKSLSEKTLPELFKDGIDTLFERSSLNEIIVDSLASSRTHSPPSFFESPFRALKSFGKTCTKLLFEVGGNAKNAVITTWGYLSLPMVSNEDRRDTTVPEAFGIRETRKDLGEISFKLGAIFAPSISDGVHGVNDRLLGINLNQVIGESIAKGIGAGLSGKTVEMLAIKTLEQLRDKSLEKYKAAPPRRVYGEAEARQIESQAKKALARHIRQAVPMIITQYFTQLRKRWDDRIYDLESNVQAKVNTLYQTTGKKSFVTVPLAFALKKFVMPVVVLSNFLAFNTLRLSLGILGKASFLTYTSFPKPISKVLNWVGNKLIQRSKTRDIGETLKYLARLEQNKVNEVLQFVHRPMHKNLIWKLGDILLLGDEEAYRISGS